MLIRKNMITTQKELQPLIRFLSYSSISLSGHNLINRTLLADPILFRRNRIMGTRRIDGPDL